MRRRCGARTRAGQPCRAPVVKGKNRCRMHGGLSTGPKTEAGRERVREGYRKSLLKELEQRELDRAAGLYAPYYCGSDLALRAQYGSPSDRRRLAAYIAAEPAKAEQQHQRPVEPEAVRKPCSGPPLPQPPSPDWDPFDL